jgi:multimeric flavodoxin WrbA
MKTIILLATLKKAGLSNTQVLSEFFSEQLKNQNIDCEIIKLVDYNILPGTYSNMGEGDDWPEILHKITDADIIIFSTPIWWDSHSSEIQKVIERLDNLHDEVLAGNKSQLEGKAGGIIITGDSDGAQHIIGNIGNFFNAVGIVLPPYASLSVLWEGQKKGATTSKDELLKKYREEYTTTVATMIRQLVKYAGVNG